MKKRILYAFCVIVVILTGCPSPSPTPEIVVSDETVIVEDNDIEEAIESIIPTGGEVSQGCSITIPSSSPLAQNLSVGNVLGCGITDKTPYGLLQKIESIEDNGDTTIVRTRPAALNEAFEELHVDTPIQIDESTVSQSVPLVKGVTCSRGSGIPGSRAGVSFSYDFLDVVLAEYGGAKIRANGNISVGISARFICDISWFHIDRIGFRVDFDEEARLEISAEYEAAIDIEIPVYTQTFNAIVIMAGYVPIVIIPTLTIMVGLDGEISASVTAGVVQYSHFDSSVVYTSSEGRWSTEQNNNSGFTPIMPRADFSCSVKAYAGPYLDIMLYGIVGPYVCARGYLALDVLLNTDPPPIPWLTLDAGVEIAVGVNITPIADALSWLGIAIDGRYEYSLPLYEVRILELPAVDLTPVNLEAISSTYLFVYETPIEMMVSIRNESDFDLPEPCTVRWEIYSPGSSVPTYTYTQSLPSLAARTTSGPLFWSWTPHLGIDTAHNRIVVTVDPDNAINELNEDNNEAILDITIEASPV
ncbi:MAG: hypothetical protein JW881_20950 [Spirochaetales bacterium]|nr:hypothetical protein [Spirochaetales bacterium]